MRIFSLRGKKKVLAPSTSRSTERPRLNASSSFAVKEAYNTIRTKLMFTSKGEKCPVFAITSSLAGDGKSANAVSLSISIAMAGKRVLLIDADMRKPTVHRYFGMESKDGLSEVLADLTTEVKIRPTDCANLSILTAGQIPPNPAELLSSKQMDTLLEYVRQYFDCVIIDTPPVNIVADTCVMADKITGYVFVVQRGKNHLRDLNDAVQQLEEMNGNIVGMILNDPHNRGEGHYTSIYKRYYRYDRYKYYGEKNSDRRK